ERQLHLTLNPANAGHAKLSPRLDCAFQQRGLAYAWLSVDHQDAPAPSSPTVQQPVERLALTFSAKQPAPRKPPNARGCCAHLVPSMPPKVRPRRRRSLGQTAGLTTVMARRLVPRRARPGGPPRESSHE